MARVHLTTHLQTFFPHLGSHDLMVEGSTVADVVRAIDDLAPGFAFYVCDERGRLRRHVNVFVEQQAIVDRSGLTDRLEPDSRVFILQALSGG